jgi:hypothetical protein
MFPVHAALLRDTVWPDVQYVGAAYRSSCTNVVARDTLNACGNLGVPQIAGSELGARDF